MDSSTTYLANNDVKDAAKTTVESGDEEIVVFANNSGNGPKSASKAADANGKVAPGTVEATEASVDASKVDGAVDNDSGANGLADAFGNLSVNPSAQPGVNFDYAARNDYRTPKYPSIAVSNGDVNPGPPGAEWQSGKGGRKPDDQYYGASNYARPLNASASDFQHRGPPNYGAYGAPGAAPYGSYQGVPAMHGSYANHSYDVFGASPTLTEPAVANGAPGAPGGVGNANGPNAPNNRYMAPNHRGSMNGEPAVLNIGAIGAAGGAPYSPLPLSPSPLTINPYAVHHHPQLQIPHINGHPMGYGPQSGPPPKNGAPGAPGSATSPGGNPTNGSGAEGGSPTSYRNLAFNMPWPNSPSEFYPESGMYANGYGAAHLPHGMPQSQYLTPQMGPPMPGTPQMGAPYGYMSPMPGAPGGPGMGVPGNHHANGVNGAHHQGGPRSAGGHNGAVHNGVGVSPTGAPPNVQVVNGLTLINGVPQPNADGTGPSANNRKLGLYKTELCRSWEEKGSCRYGPKCQFAHGEEEIRKVARHPKYKTEICRTFWLSGSCPYGKRCCFIHTDAPAGAATADPSKATAGGTGPSTAPNGATTPNGTAIDGSANAGGHTRTTSSTSDAAEQPPSSLLARISAKRNVEDKTPPPTSGPARLAPNGAARPDYSSHNRHLSSMSDGRPTEVEAAPAFPTSRPGHSHSASAHTLMTPTFASPANGAVGGYGSNVGTPGVDGNGNLTPGSYWGHKRSASGGSATNGGWNTPTADVAAEQPPVRSIYSALTPSA